MQVTWICSEDSRTLLTCMLKRIVKCGAQGADLRTVSGAKAGLLCGAFTARLKLRPDTKAQRPQPFFRLLLLLPLLLTTVGGCRRKHFPKYPANFREYAWVTNGGDRSVTVLDLVNMRTAATIPVGDRPVAVAVNPVKDEVYVVNAGSGSVSVVSAAENRVIAAIDVHREPVSIDVDKEGRRGYVANAGSNNVSVIDLEKRREIAAVGVGESPAEAKISPDGNTLVVTNRRGGSVTVVDARDLKVRAVFGGCPGASDVVILPDSSKAFAACSSGHQVMAVGLARPESPMPEEHKDRLLTLMDVGPAPAHLALKPDGGEIFVSNYGGDTVSEIATNANNVGGAYVMGANPLGGVVTADNSILWESNFGDSTVGAYSIDDGVRINTVQVGEGPGPLALASGGFLLLAVDRTAGDVSVLRTVSYTPKGVPVTGSLFTVLSAGRDPNGIAVKSFTVK